MFRSAETSGEAARDHKARTSSLSTAPKVAGPLCLANCLNASAVVRASLLFGVAVTKPKGQKLEIL